jgi:hypothetical protein
MERRELLAHARRSYEAGRWRLARRTLLLSLPMAGVSLAACRHLVVGVPLAAALVVVAAVLALRGGIAGRAAMPGLLAGLAPMLLPLTACVGCSLNGASVGSVCFPACVAGGLVGGAVLWTSAARVTMEGGGRREFLLVAGTLASIAGALGCVVLGVGGVLAMMAALVASSAPAMLVSARSS